MTNMTMLIVTIVIGLIALAFLGWWHGQRMFALGTWYGRQREAMDARHARERIVEQAQREMAMAEIARHQKGPTT